MRDPDSKPIKTLSLGAGVQSSPPKLFDSLGAGVQSSVQLLMAEAGEIEKPDAAIFADTQDEPRHLKTQCPTTGEWITGGIYGWIEWLRLKVSFPIYTVSKGELMQESFVVHTSKKTGNKYFKGNIPAFVDKGDGSKGLLSRYCTVDYKVTPVQRKVKELCGVKRGGKDVIARVRIGISTDEAHRMKPSRVPYILNEFPLIDTGMSRQDCKEWMRHRGYPTPPRSACRSCPFHSDKEWKNLKDNARADFDKAVETERRMQHAAGQQSALRGTPYLHSSCVPLDEVGFGATSGDGQLELWGNECEGMCGV
jgi:hypothetical protein